MRFLVAIGIVGSFWMAGVLHARTEQTVSTWSGVYTEAQAKTGQANYTKVCAECHGQDLNGDGYAPPLKGPDFMTNWNGLTVAEFFDRIRVSMPPSNPNAATAKEKVEIVAYILKESGFPAGDKELPTTADGMKTIKIESTKPGR